MAHDIARLFAVRHQGNWMNLIHPGAAICAALAPNGDFYIVNSAHGQLVQRRTQDFSIIRRLNGHRMTVADVAILSGRASASCSADGSTRHWDLETSEQVAVLRHEVGAIFVARLSDIRGLTVLEDGSTCCWEHGSSAAVWSTPSGSGRPTGVAFDELGRRAFVLTSNSELVEVDVDTGDHATIPLRDVSGDAFSGVSALAVNPGSDLLTFGSISGGLARQVVIRTTGAVVAETPIGPAPSHCSVWLDHSRLIVGVDDGRLLEFRMEDQALRVVRERQVHRDIIWTLHHTALTDELITGSSDGTVARIGVTNLDERARLRGLTRGVWATAWHPDGHRLLSAAGDGTVALWDSTSGERLAHAQLAGGWIRHVSWRSPDEALVVAQKGVIYRVGPDLNLVEELGLGVHGNVWCAAIDTDTGQLGFGTDHGEVGVVTVANGDVAITHKLERLISAVAWRAHDSLIVGTATGEGFLVVPREGAKQQAHPIPTLNSQDEITAILVTRNAGLVVGYSSGRVVVISNESKRWVIGQHDGPVQSLVEPNTGCVASCGADGAINHWSLRDGRLISRHDVEVSLAGLSISGDRVACGSAGAWVFTFSGSSAIPGPESFTLSDPPVGLLDSPTPDDTIGRTALAQELAFLCQRTTLELERTGAVETLVERGFLLHIGGEWGTGKTTLAQMVLDQLVADEHAGRWTNVVFNVWQEAEGEPLDDLLTALDQSAGELATPARRVWLALTRFWIRRPGLFRGLFQLLSLFVIIAVGLRFLLTLVVTPASASHRAVTINSNLLSALVALGAGVLALGSFLASRARPVVVGVHARRRDADLARTHAYEKAVLRRLPSRVLVVIDEIDRCQPTRLLAILQACHQLITVNAAAQRRRRKRPEEPSLAFLLLSDREWLNNGIEASYPTQAIKWESRTKRLGSAFMEKLALLSFDVPSLSQGGRAALVASATSGDTFVSAEVIHPPPEAQTASDSQIHAVPKLSPAEQDHDKGHASPSPPARTLMMPAISSTNDPKNRELVERGPEIERRMRVEQTYITQYAGLIGSTPREIKRVLVRYWLDRVTARAEGRDVVRFADAILFESIVTVRWPNLYPAVRARKPGGIQSLLTELGVVTDHDLVELVAALDKTWKSERQERKAQRSLGESNTP